MNFPEVFRPDVERFLVQVARRRQKDMPAANVIRVDQGRMSKAEWRNVMAGPDTLAHPISFVRYPFHSSVVLSLNDLNDTYQDVSVKFELAFLKTDSGLLVAGIRVEWSAPVKRKSP